MIPKMLPPRMRLLVSMAVSNHKFNCKKGIPVALAGIPFFINHDVFCIHFHNIDFTKLKILLLR